QTGSWSCQSEVVGIKVSRVNPSTRRPRPAERGFRDRRAVQVGLTRRGKTFDGGLLKTVIAFDQTLRNGLDVDDAETLRRLLDHLRDNIGHGTARQTEPR